MKRLIGVMIAVALISAVPLASPAAAHSGNCSLRMPRPFMFWDTTPDGPNDGAHWDIKAKMIWDCNGHGHDEHRMVLRIEKKRSDGGWNEIAFAHRTINNRDQDPVGMSDRVRCVGGTFRGRGAVSTFNDKGQLVHHVASKVSNAKSFTTNICASAVPARPDEYNQQAELEADRDFVSYPEDPL